MLFYKSAIVLMVVSCAEAFLFGWNPFSLRSNGDHQNNIPPILGGIATLVSSKCDAINGLFRSRLERTVNKDEIRLYLYIGKGFISYKVSEAPTHLFESSPFSPFQKTIIFVHGYVNTPDEPNVEKIAENYFKRGGYNFLSFATNAYTSGDYLTAVGLTPYLGRILADFILELVDRGLSYDSIHVVGYSLGAQFAGVAGRIIRRERGHRLPRITAIDPATVCFASPNRPKISRSDAKYVDAIHTSILSFSQDGVGHADFYVNGDSGVQPGCESSSTISCSHTRSIMIYAESVLDEAAFMARSCDSWENFSSGGCGNGKLSTLGNGSPPNSRGKYFLKTSNTFPFGLGPDGL